MEFFEEKKEKSRARNLKIISSFPFLLLLVFETSFSFLAMADLADFISFSSVEALNEKNPEHSFQNALKKVRTRRAGRGRGGESIDSIDGHRANFFLRPQPSHPLTLRLRCTIKNNNHAIKQGYREDAGLFLESDTDEQLLINIPFTQGRRERKRQKEKEKPDLDISLLSLSSAHLRNPKNNSPITQFSRQAHVHRHQGPRRGNCPPKSPHLRQQALAGLPRGRVRPLRRRV